MFIDLSREKGFQLRQERNVPPLTGYCLYFVPMGLPKKRALPHGRATAPSP